jgi:hypothetical protein
MFKKGDKMKDNNPMTKEDHDYLTTSFEYHSVGVQNTNHMADIRQKAHDLATTIVNSCQHTRARSVALTKCEEAMMWANKAIAEENTQT